MEKRLEIYTDGGARGNPGPAACAFTIIKNGKIIYQYAKKIGWQTNNVAEYSGILEALKFLSQNKNYYYGFSEIFFKSDSQLIVNQLNARYKIKNKKLQTLIIQIKNLEKTLDIKIYYDIVSRLRNQKTDTLINQILDDFHNNFLEKIFS